MERTYKPELCWNFVLKIKWFMDVMVCMNHTWSEEAHEIKQETHADPDALHFIWFFFRALRRPP